MLEIVNNAASVVTCMAINAFKVLMAGGREFVKKKKKNGLYFREKKNQNHIVVTDSS